ncbi:hypothetical protein ACOME3_004045 [Neoechinorhynchus agilis]
MGEPDDGKTSVQRNKVDEAILANNAKLGRNGLGSSLVIAAGNGGHYFDHCSIDRVVNSPYVVAVAGILRNGSSPMYAERCASIMTTSYTGDGLLNNIVTAGINGTCDEGFLGTSASAPMVAAIIALGLEANPSLDYRQIQSLVVLSSKKKWTMTVPWTRESVWWRNGAGLWVSDVFGFGILSARSFVQGAKALINKRSLPLRICSVNVLKSRFVLIRPLSVESFRVCSDACNNTPSSITLLEHVILQVTLVPKYVQRGKRGMLAIDVKSPSGKFTTYLGPRAYDDDKHFGFNDYLFTSVLNWFEDPRGCWYVDVKNFDASGSFYILKMSLVLRVGNAKSNGYLADLCRLGHRGFFAVTVAGQIDPLKSAACNIQSLVDKKDTERPALRTALVGKELQAPSKTGRIKESSSGYTFGTEKEELRIQFVGLAVKRKLVEDNSFHPVNASERLPNPYRQPSLI